MAEDDLTTPRPVAPRDAATLILLRDGTAAKAPFEVLMLKRAPRNRFVPDVFVFPGGGLDVRDYEPPPDGNGALQIEGRDRLAGDCGLEFAMAARIGALRETFEETGILLAAPSGTPSHGGPSASGALLDAAQRLEQARRRLMENRTGFRSVLGELGLAPDISRLYYFSHWITPEASTIRYNVRFFVAATSGRQECVTDNREIVDSCWISPQRALELHRSDRFPLVLPTRTVLQELAGFDSVATVMAAALRKEVPAICSRAVIRNGVHCEVLPEDVQPGDELVPPQRPTQPAGAEKET